ncbi:hypothetical protein FSP39_021728 [Pinctada imbricata]|uniref:EGF-like domain-containing protein n=1 Tax=Pinctada imbricata TaxID=66713 RepID=A0AA88YLD5_PINIB|nr:hypothetical protein FSP39_021728 [Pinctada imbricata]
MYTCTCDSGFTGKACETNINECASNPCRNGGSCIDGVNRYTCNCLPGYTGNTCATNINECASNPCRNGGSCIDRVNGYVCNCSAGFVGKRCANKCADGRHGLNCQGQCNCPENAHEVCKKDSGICHCKPGYDGDTCNRTCEAFTYGVLCLGRCRCNRERTLGCDKNNGACQCMQGWEGISCDLPVPEPLSSPVGAVVASLATIIVIIGIVVGILYAVYKRKMFRSKQPTVAVKSDANGEQSIVYQNQDFKLERDGPSGGEPAYANTSGYHMNQSRDRPMLTNQNSEDTYEGYTPQESPYEGLKTEADDNHLYDGLQKKVENKERDSSAYASLRTKINKFNKMT